MKSLQKLLQQNLIPADMQDNAKAFIGKRITGVPGQALPEIIHMCGIPGSGKTTYSRVLSSEKENHFRLNFDDIMEQLPGYRDTLEKSGSEQAFEDYQLPARAIGYALLDALIGRKAHIIFDHGALHPLHINLLQEMKDNNYDIKMIYIKCTVREALPRIVQRERMTGRHTPLEMIEKRNDLLSSLLPKYKDIEGLTFTEEVTTQGDFTNYLA